MVIGASPPISQAGQHRPPGDEVSDIPAAAGPMPVPRLLGRLTRRHGHDSVGDNRQIDRCVGAMNQRPQSPGRRDRLARHLDLLGMTVWAGLSGRRPSTGRTKPRFRKGRPRRCRLPVLCRHTWTARTPVPPARDRAYQRVSDSGHTRSGLAAEGRPSSSRPRGLERFSDDGTCSRQGRSPKQRGSRPSPRRCQSGCVAHGSAMMLPTS
jgi:hypothetical protein